MTNENPNRKKRRLMPYVLSVFATVQGTPVISDGFVKPKTESKMEIKKENNKLPANADLLEVADYLQKKNLPKGDKFESLAVSILDEKGDWVSEISKGEIDMITEEITLKVFEKVAKRSRKSFDNVFWQFHNHPVDVFDAKEFGFKDFKTFKLTRPTQLLTGPSIGDCLRNYKRFDFLKRMHKSEVISNIVDIGGTWICLETEKYKNLFKNGDLPDSVIRSYTALRVNLVRASQLDLSISGNQEKLDLEIHKFIKDTYNTVGLKMKFVRKGSNSQVYVESYEEMKRELSQNR